MQLKELQKLMSSEEIDIYVAFEGLPNQGNKVKGGRFAIANDGGRQRVVFLLSIDGSQIVKFVSDELVVRATSQ